MPGSQAALAQRKQAALARGELREALRLKGELAAAARRQRAGVVGEEALRELRANLTLERDGAIKRDDLQARPSSFFVLVLPHVTLIELPLALISYQDNHMLSLTLFQVHAFHHAGATR